MCLNFYCKKYTHKHMGSWHSSSKPERAKNKLRLLMCPPSPSYWPPFCQIPLEFHSVNIYEGTHMDLDFLLVSFVSAHLFTCVKLCFEARTSEDFMGSFHWEIWKEFEGHKQLYGVTDTPLLDFCPELWSQDGSPRLCASSLACKNLFTSEYDTCRLLGSQHGKQFLFPYIFSSRDKSTTINYEPRLSTTNLMACR